MNSLLREYYRKKKILSDMKKKAARLHIQQLKKSGKICQTVK